MDFLHHLGETQEVNRQQRRNQSRSNSNTRRTGVTYLAIVGIAGGSLGIAIPAQAASGVTSCTELENELSNAASLGGNIVANFSDTCDFAEGFVFNEATTITGPTNGSLIFSFSGNRTPNLDNGIADGFTVMDSVALNISNIDFVRPSKPLDFDEYNFNYFIYGQENRNVSITIENSTFSSESNSLISSAIYAEGNLSISDSSFTDLNSYNGGAAISANNSSTTTITNSVFTDNNSFGQSSGGAISSNGSLSVSDSTFESNSTQSGSGGAIVSYGNIAVRNSVFSSNSAAQSYGGAIAGFSNVDIDNSTLVSNSALYAGASYSEGGGVISNSTYWLNSVGEPSSTVIDSYAPLHLFANILADERPISAARSYDLGANLYTDTSFEFGSNIEIVPVSVSETSIMPLAIEGLSRRVSLDELKLSPLAMNTGGLVNTGKTKSVAIGADSVARDFYSATSAGINPTGLNIPDGNQFDSRIAAMDQRGVARPISVGYDVGAFEYGVDPTVVAPAVAPKATISKQIIKFAPGSSKLSAVSKKTLRNLATEIQAKGLKAVNLEGYTATLSKAAPSGKVFRIKLSRARAAAVEKYLKEQFKKSNYSVTFTKSSKGAANRVKSNKTEKGRIDNRRVEISIN